jgi:hypothetical protein
VPAAESDDLAEMRMTSQAMSSALEDKAIGCSMLTRSI